MCGGGQVRAAILSSSDWNRVPAVGLKLASPNAIANALLDDPVETIASDGTDIVNITDMHFRCCSPSDCRPAALTGHHQLFVCA